MTEQASDQPNTGFNAEMKSLLHCRRCKLPYASSRSTSSLRLTYCSLFCELSDLGFSMDALEHMEKAPEQPETDEQEREPVAVD